MLKSRRVLGIVLGGVGLIWLGQGFGYIPGSFMTGSMFWAVMGAICAVGGVVIIVSDKRGK